MLFSFNFGDPAGIRTQDPILKRDVLYPAELLSHPVYVAFLFKGAAKLGFLCKSTKQKNAKFYKKIAGIA